MNLVQIGVECKVCDFSIGIIGPDFSFFFLAKSICDLGDRRILGKGTVEDPNFKRKKSINTTTKIFIKKRIKSVINFIASCAPVFRLCSVRFYR